MGTPDRYIEGTSASYGDESEYVDFSFDSYGNVEAIYGSPWLFSCDDQSLYEESDTVSAIFGVEDYPLGGAGQMFQTEWDVGDYAFIFNYPKFADETGHFYPIEIMVSYF